MKTFQCCITNEFSPHSVLLPHVVPRFKTSRGHTSTPTCTFLTECLIMHGDNFTFLSTKTYTHLRGYVSYRQSVTKKTWVRSQPGPCGIPCDPGTVPPPKFFSFIIYQCSILELLIYLSI